jgi:hypothetical protein
MADYRALAQALDPYAMDTGGITPDTIKALQSGYKSPNLLGMIADIGRGGLSNLESLVRGGVAQFAGTPVDTLNTIRTPYPMEVMGDVNYAPDKQVYGGTKDILGMMPKRVTQGRPETAGMEELGTVMGPGLAKGVAPAVKGYASLLGNEVNAGMTGQPTRSIIGQITPKPLQLDVYHGTPHKLSSTETNPLGEFDASKIGSGAGAQAYGYGIYTSESPQFADYYAVKKGLPDLEGIASQNGIELSKDARVELMRQATRDSNGRPTKADNYIDPMGAVKKLQNANIEARQLPADKLQNTIREFQDQNKAYLYKADLPDKKIPQMLDWETPVPEELRQRISEVMMKEFGSGATGTSGEKLYKEIQAEYRRAGSDNPAKDASAFLQKQGVPGITYKEIDTRNYVTFPDEEKNIKILERQDR